LDPDRLDFYLELTDREHKFMDSAVGLNEVWGDDEVYGPLDFEI
jgi:hypothetical protein